MKALALALLVFGALGVAQADGLRATIEASNKKIHAAMMKKDFVALDAIFKAGMTKDFKYVENGKTQTYDQMMQGMKMGMGQLLKVTVVSTKIVNLKEQGSSGACTAAHTMGGTMKGPDKKSHTSLFTGVAVETYRKVGKDWKMSKMEWKSAKMLVDGKPMAMPAAG